MKKVLLALACLISITAQAGQFTALAGASQFTPQSDGIWYQEPFPYTLNMRSGSLGLRYDTEVHDNWSFGAGYMHLGSVTSTAKATAKDNLAPNDNGYSAGLKGCAGTCWPLSTWYGKGNVQGLFGTATYHSGPWAIEAGVYAYRPQWKVTIPDYIDCRNCKPRYLMVEHKANIQYGPMVGINYTQAPWSLHVSAWRVDVSGDDHIAVWTGWTRNVSLGYSF